MNDDPFANVPLRTGECPFKVGDRIHEIEFRGVTTSLGATADRPFEDSYTWELHPNRPDAIVTELTERGFCYRYDSRVPIGRAAWGTWTEGGECFEDGFQFWRKI